MKKLATFALTALLLLPAALTACSQPDASTGDGSDSTSAIDSTETANDDSYVGQVTTELEMLDQQIEELQGRSPSVQGMNRLLAKQETARQQLTLLEQADGASRPEAKRQMKRSLTQLKRVYERVYERAQPV